MTLYINQDTNEYPRHPGDVELNPTANWAEVTRTEPVGQPAAGKVWVEDAPQKISGVWKQQWKQATIKVRTKEDEMQHAASLGIDLSLLGLE